MQKLVSGCFLLIGCLVTGISHAAVNFCPSINSIINGDLEGWKIQIPEKTLQKKLLDANHEASTATKWISADWQGSENNNSGTGSCYYSDYTSFHFTLWKSNLPKPTASNWSYQSNKGFCGRTGSGNPYDCPFA